MPEFTREQEAAAERLALQYDTVKVEPTGLAGLGLMKATCYDGGHQAAAFIINAAGETRGE